MNFKENRELSKQEKTRNFHLILRKLIQNGEIEKLDSENYDIARKVFDKLTPNAEGTIADLFSTIKVYRKMGDLDNAPFDVAIQIKNGKNPGRYWSFCKEGANAYGGTSMEGSPSEPTLAIEGEVMLSKVNVPASIISNIELPEECEVIIPNGGKDVGISKIQYRDVEKVKKYSPYWIDLDTHNIEYIYTKKDCNNLHKKITENIGSLEYSYNNFKASKNKRDKSLKEFFFDSVSKLAENISEFKENCPIVKKKI